MSNYKYINQELENIKEILHKHYEKESSYNQNLSTIRKFLHDNVDLFQKPNSVCNNIVKICDRIEQSNKKNATKKKLFYLFSIICNRKKSQIKYLELYKLKKKTILKDRTKNEALNIKEADNLSLSFEKLRKLGIQKNFTQHDLLFNLLIFIDETPRLEYRTLRYAPTHSFQVGKNYLTPKVSAQLDSWMIILDSYKTRETYKTWYIQIENRKLNKYLTDYFNFFGLAQNTLVFPNSKQKIRPSNKFSEFVQRMFKTKTGKSININSLRKIKECALFHRNPEINALSVPLDKKQNFVEKYFKHSLQTAQLYYHKIDCNDEPSQLQSETEENIDDEYEEDVDEIQPKKIKKRKKLTNKPIESISKTEWQELYKEFVQVTKQKYPDKTNLILKQLEKSLKKKLI